MFRIIVVAACLGTWAVAQPRLRYETRRFEKKTSNCVVSFEYPEITSAASPEVRDRIDAGIRKVLLRMTQYPPAPSHFQSLEQYATNFCGTEHAHPALRGRKLYEHKIVKFHRSTPPVFSFRCDASVDAGGVHPYGTTLYLNFNSETGKPVRLVDILRPGALPALRSVAESRFREDHKLSATDSLAEVSFNFPNDRFELNDNYGIGDEAVVFLFNTYEISAGAMGPTEIVIPYSDIRDLMVRDITVPGSPARKH